jgi:hypothetical protein
MNSDMEGQTAKAFEAVSFSSLFGLLFEIFVGDMPFLTARSLFFYRERYDFFVG